MHCVALPCVALPCVDPAALALAPLPAFRAIAPFAPLATVAKPPMPAEPQPSCEEATGVKIRAPNRPPAAVRTPGRGPASLVHHSHVGDLGWIADAPEVPLDHRHGCLTEVDVLHQFCGIQRLPGTR